MTAVLNWYGCDLVTGAIVEELQDLVPQGNLSSFLGNYFSAALTLPIPISGFGDAPNNWLGATEEGRTMIVCALNNQPIWAGIVLVRQGGSDATVSLSCITLEGYLDRRYVGNHTYTQQDQSSVIAAGLIGDANTTEGIGFTVDAPASGTLRDRTYLDQDDKTVLSALRELMAVDGGPEWAVVLSWTDTTQTAIKKTFMVRPRIGYASDTPNAVFSTEALSDTTYMYTEDYTSGRGANHVVATSSGQGTTRPQSAPARDTASLAAGWPRWEYRFSPSSSITNVATLNAHATNTLGITRRGAHILTLKARLDAFPMLGTDWTLGDDIGFELKGHRHPAGLTGTARVVGWELDVLAGTVSPILYAPAVEGT